MQESEFHTRVDEMLLAIEEAIDESGADLDYENSAGILTLILENGSQIILNRQTPARQLWLAARSGGYHFDWSEAEQIWRSDSDGSSLSEILNRSLQEQGGEPLPLP